MGQKQWIWLFAAEAALCAALSVLLRGTAGMDAGVLAFPFAQIGRGLRALSLSGAAGNAAAISLYVLLSLIPAAAFVLRLRRAERDGEDALLLLMSATLFGVLYLMINPALLGRSNIPASMVRPALGGLVYAELCAYAVLRVLRGAFDANAARLRRYLRALLLALAAVLVYDASGGTATELLDGLESLKKANTGSTGLGWTQAFLTVRALAGAVTPVLDVWVIFAALRLIDARAAGEIGPAEQAAQTLAARCRAGLSISVLLSLTVYLAQVLFSERLRQVALDVTFPLTSITFCLGALLLARLMQENRRLQADNDLFI